MKAVGTRRFNEGEESESFARGRMLMLVFRHYFGCENVKHANNTRVEYHRTHIAASLITSPDRCDSGSPRRTESPLNFFFCATLHDFSPLNDLYPCTES